MPFARLSLTSRADVAWKDANTVWAVGGSGVIFESRDGGRSFKFNDNAKDIPGNLYRLGGTRSYERRLPLKVVVRSE